VARARLLEALVAAGERARARREYRAFARRLARALGAAPSPDLAAALA